MHPRNIKPPTRRLRSAAYSRLRQPGGAQWTAWGWTFRKDLRWRMSGGSGFRSGFEATAYRREAAKRGCWRPPSKRLRLAVPSSSLNGPCEPSRRLRQPCPWLTVSETAICPTPFIDASAKSLELRHFFLPTKERRVSRFTMSMSSSLGPSFGVSMIMGTF